MTSISPALAAPAVGASDDFARHAVATGQPAPLSFQQQQLWFLQRYEPGLTAYNLPRAFRLHGRLDADALERAFRALIQRHAVLRTVFSEEAGVPVQTVLPNVGFTLQREDVSRMAPEPREQRVQQHLAEVASHVFDLGAPPALVARLVKTGDEEHVLAVCLHHIVSDAWSNPLLAGDLAAAYRLALRQPGEVRLPALPVQYADYAAWQRAWAQQGGLTRELDHWMRHLGPTVPVLELPTGRARPAQQTYAGAVEVFDVDAQLVQRVQAWCRTQRCTPFVALLAAWQAVLARSSGQSDFAVGVPQAARRDESLDELIGFFVNTQVFRARVPLHLTLEQLCRQVRDDALAALDHAQLPFELLLESRKLQRDPARSPLFQVMFGVQVEQPGQALSFDGLQVEAIEVEEQAAKHELSLDMMLGSQGVQGRLEYNTDLFDRSTARRLVQSFLQVLDTLVRAPQTVVGELPTLDDEARDRLAAWGGGPHVDKPGDWVHRRFERHAAQFPEAVALVLDAQSLSYAELNRRANRLAHRLIGLGVGPEVRVGLALERSVEMVVALLAVLKAGGAYVPLDPDYPAERLQWMVQDSGIALLLTQQHVHARLQLPAALRVLQVDTEALQPQPEHDPQVPLHGEHLAYVIYTSGSTGRPKGIAIAHHALASHTQVAIGYFGLSAADRMLLFSTINFDGFIEQLFPPLCAGAGIVLRGPLLWDSETFYRAVIEQRITIADLTTAYWFMLVQDYARHGPRDYGALRQMQATGEAMPPEGIQAWRDAGLGHVKLLNTYGPTETTVTATCFDCAPCIEGSLPTPANMPIGTPLGGRRLHVLDEALQPVPPGVPGELCIGGALLARGYVNRAGLTAERFVADPFEAGGRLYRTGDLVRWRPDGQLEYLGRIDHQVKIRGFRIELGEVEAQLLAQPGVREAVAVAQGAAGSARLVGYVAPQPQAQLQPQALREALAQALPEYMVPAVIVVLDALPLNPNGKIDRKALPAPRFDETVGQEAPQGEVEQCIANAWREVLGVPRVGRHDNFFELGGDSILSLQIVARLRAAGWKLTPRQIFEHQTVAGQAGVIEPAGTPAALTGTQTPPEGEVPLLPIQHEFFALRVPNPHHWNQAVLLRSAACPEVQPLAAALQALAEHHDALRLRYVQQADGCWSQRYTSPAAHELLWVRDVDDASHIDTRCSEAQRSLHLADGPLLRALLLRLPDGSSRLLLAAHHLVVDGVSWRILLQDLETAYKQARSGQPIALPARTSSCLAWSRRLRDAIVAHAGEVTHWQSLAHVPASLPCARPAGANTARHATDVSLTLDRACTQALLRDAPAAYRTQVNDLLLTALGRALCRWSGHERVLIDLEGHGREDLFDDIDLSRTVGWFTTLCPVELSPAGTLADALKRVKEGLRAVPRKGIGYGLLKHCGTPEQRQAVAALPTRHLVFNYLGQIDGTVDAQGRWAPVDEPGGAATDADTPLEHEFSVNGSVFDGELRLAVTFSAARHDASTVRAWVDDWRCELEALVAHCTSGAAGLTPSDLPLAGLTQAQLDALPLESAQVEDLYPLSPMQAGMLFHTLVDPDDPTYVTQLRVDIDGLHVDRFRSAWQCCVQRHAALRTGFVTAGDRPLQWVMRNLAIDVEQHDLRDVPDLREALDALAARQRSGFDLAHPPLMRLVLAHTGEQRHHFIWSCHHLLLDGWSASRLLADVLRLYAGGEPALPALPYRRYIEWLSSSSEEDSRAYWTAQLQPLDEPTHLANALPRPLSGAGYAFRERHLDEYVTRRLVEFARRERVTLNTLVQGAWALLLGKYTGRSTVAYGVTTAGRPDDLPGAQDMLGMFINTIPLVATLPSGQAIADWLRDLQHQQLAAREHEHTALYEIQQWVGQGGRALFDSIVVFENYPVDAALQQGPTAGLQFSTAASVEETNYPMTLAVSCERSISMRYGHALDHFDAATVDRIADQLEHLLQAISESSGQALGALALPAPEAEDATLPWGRIQRPAAAPASLALLHELIERQARRRPEATALVHGTQRVSYGELNRHANRLAHRLAAHGVGPEVRVGVAMERSVDLIVGLLAVLKAGGAYVPLDPQYPTERLAWMVQDSGMTLLLTHSGLRDRMASLQTDTAVMELDREPMLDAPEHDPEVPVHGAQLAYVIYTSGSTGRPKGAQLSHANVVRLLQSTQGWFGFDEHDTWTLFHSYAFDFSVWEIFGALCHGGTLIIVPYLVSRSPRDMLQLLRDERVTVLNQTPSAFTQLLQLPQLDEVDDLALRLVIFGGEALEPDSLRRWIERYGDERPRLINMYGITETTVHVTYRPITRADLGGARSPIGRPIPDLGLRVLDAHLQPVPVGVAGELYVAGAGLARGYLNRAGLSAERFVADPFDEHGARLYRSGDLARWRADGEIEYLGRVDHQVKIRGFRIELGEVQTQLLSLSGVHEAVVLDRPGPGGTQLVGYVTAQPGTALDAKALRGALEQRLPEHMLPSAIVVLDALPLTANGKVDRKALPAPDAVEADRWEAPQDGLEQRLAALWSGVLNLQRIGRHANFFELGGHSLLAVQLAARIERELGRPCGVADVFQAPTLSALAARLAAAPAPASAQALQEIDAFIDTLESF